MPRIQIIAIKKAYLAFVQLKQHEQAKMLDQAFPDLELPDCV